MAVSDVPKIALASYPCKLRNPTHELRNGKQPRTWYCELRNARTINIYWSIKQWINDSERVNFRPAQGFAGGSHPITILGN